VLAVWTDKTFGKIARTSLYDMKAWDIRGLKAVMGAPFSCPRIRVSSFGIRHYKLLKD
jgi:hypothetical protein